MVSTAHGSTNTEAILRNTKMCISVYTHVACVGNSLKQQHAAGGTVTGMLSPSLVSTLLQMKESEENYKNILDPENEKKLGFFF